MIKNKSGPVDYPVWGSMLNPLKMLRIIKTESRNLHMPWELWDLD